MTRGIFIVGAGRSGTKFLMNMLNNSDSVHVAPEMHFFSRLVHSGFRKNLRKRCRRSAGEYDLDEVTSCILDGGHFGTYWRRENAFTAQGIREWFRGRSVDEEDIYRFLIEYDAGRHAAGKNLRLLGEKTPSNIFHLRTLTGWFPDARIIYIYRDPVAVLRSEVNKGSKPDYPLGKGNPFYAWGLVPYVLAVWVTGALYALSYRRKYPHMYLVSYEALCTDPGKNLQRLAELCGFEYTADLSRVHRVDSSFGDGAAGDVWEPPSAVRFLYSILTGPLRSALDRKSILGNSR